MSWSHFGIFAGGVAAAGILGAMSQSKAVHDGLVHVTAGFMKCGDAVTSATQSLVDDANDLNAEARRQKKIDLAVKARLEELEKGVRDEVTAQVDAEAQPTK